MIRTLSGTKPTPAQLRKRRRRPSVWDIGPGPYAAREASEEAPSTPILLCASCLRAFPLHTHDELTCGTKRGRDGNDLYVREHALALTPRARMDAATVEQARAVISDLVRALRSVDPAHPVLDSLGCFAEVSHGA